MTRWIVVCSLMVGAAAVLPAQTPRGPHGAGPGPAGFGGGMGMMSAWPGSKTPVTGAPYSGVQTTEVQRKLEDGNQISRESHAKVYRDSQGRVRMEHTGVRPRTGEERTTITIFDPVAGSSYVLDPETKKAVRMSMRAGKMGGPGVGPGMRRGAGPMAGKTVGQVQTEDLGTQNINGLAATGTRTTETIPVGAIGNQQPIQVVRETWISTALKVPVQIKSSDPRFGNSTMELTGVTQGEPDATLFQVPSDYTLDERGSGRGGRMMQQRFR